MVKGNGGFAEELSPLALRAARGDLTNDVDPVRITASQFEYMPVAAVHRPVETERLEGEFDVGSDLLSSPVPMIGLRGDA